ncbi:MAG: 5-formyltetrahydrofolate cyclo-ligase [Opitutia bacterium]
METRELKARLRTTLLAARRALSADERRAAAAAVTAGVRASAAWRATRAVALYQAYGAELDTAELRAAAHADGKTVALPRLDATGVTLRIVAADTPLVVSAHGVREPADDRPTLPPDQPELIVVPGLGFDRRGGRLGHGGGHYDRLLARLPAACRRVGLAYDQQILDVVPTEPHDLALHALVTPAGWVDCGI